MSIEATYEEQIARVRKNAEMEVDQIKIEYLLRHVSHFEIGDILQDKYSDVRIKVESYHPRLYKDLKECTWVYKGIRLKKDNTPFKSNEIPVLYHSRVEKVK